VTFIMTRISPIKSKKEGGPWPSSPWVRMVYDQWKGGRGELCLPFDSRSREGGRTDSLSTPTAEGGKKNCGPDSPLLAAKKGRGEKGRNLLL